MSISPEEAAMEEAYGRIINDYLEDNFQEVIAKAQDNKIGVYYSENYDVAARAERALDEAEHLINVSTSASLVFAMTAVELALKDTIIRPLAEGIVGDGPIKEPIVKVLAKSRDFRRFSYAFLKHFHIDIEQVQFEGETTNVKELIERLAERRNAVIHRGEKALAAEAGDGILLAKILLRGIYPALRQCTSTEGWHHPETEEGISD